MKTRSCEARKTCTVNQLDEKLIGNERQSLFFILHRANYCDFGVFKEYLCAYRVYMEFWHYDLPPIFLDRSNGVVNRIYSDSAFKPEYRLAFHNFKAFLHRAVNPGVGFVAGLNQIEIGWPPRGKLPPESVFVKNLRARHVVGID